MKTWIAAIALAGALWGCDAKANTTSAEPAGRAKVDGPAYTATVKIDDV